MNEAQIDAMDDYASSDQFDAQEKAVLRFAEQLTQGARVNADTVNELKGFMNDAQLVVLAAAVGQANFTNRFNKAVAVELP